MDGDHLNMSGESATVSTLYKPAPRQTPKINENVLRQLGLDALVGVLRLSVVTTFRKGRQAKHSSPKFVADAQHRASPIISL